MEQQAREILSPFQAAGDWEGAYAIVARYNEPRVAKIAKNDWYRLERALEVFLMTPGDQETYTGVRRALDSKYDFRCFFLIAPREPLNRIIDVRCVQMVERGLLEETSELLINGMLNPASPPGRAIGYRQAIEYLKRPIDKEQEEEEEGEEGKAFESFLEDFATATRRYAKTQMTWYRAQEEFIWTRWDLSDMQSVKELVHACYTEGREEHEARRKGEEQKHLREENVEEGKKMKVYQSKILEVGGGERWTALLKKAVECRRRVLAEGIEGEVGR